MKIGILSDTHNDIANLSTALVMFHQEGINQIIHCGDLTDPQTAKYFEGFQVTYVYGNIDSSIEEISRIWKDQNNNNWVGELFCGEIGGEQIAITHGHIDGQINSLAISGKFKYVFHGHTHRRRDEKVGKVRVINPGAVAKSMDGYSICVLDFSNGENRFFMIH